MVAIDLLLLLPLSADLLVERPQLLLKCLDCRLIAC
jgi:hypothetical protein